ncbi:ketopantoate reductase family protein [Streptomyces lydicus]|uniref:ketopantoate reductase family protein n=1 Tax=Streptomyces lydicus TaxID=47763 RepID=UPI00369914FA
MPQESRAAAPARLAVIGAGAIGGYTAALAHWAGLDVTLCVRAPLDGLTVESGGEARAAARPCCGRWTATCGPGGRRGEPRPGVQEGCSGARVVRLAGVVRWTPGFRVPG